MWTTESCKTSTMLQKYNDYSDVIGIVRAQQEGHTLSKLLTGLITLRLVEGDVLWRVSEDDVNCGSIEVCEWLLKNTVDSSSKVSTFVNSSTSKWYLSNFRSRLALLCIFWVGFGWGFQSFFGNDLSGSYSSYSKGFMKFGWLETPQKLINFSNFSLVR